MGLPGAPQIKLLEKSGKNRERGEQKKAEDSGPIVIHQRLADSDNSDEENGEDSDEGSDEEGSGSESESGSESGSGSDSGSDSESDDAPPVPRPAEKVRTKYDRMFERKNQSILTDHYSKLVAHEDDLADGDDDVFTLARRDHDLDLGSDAEIDSTAPIDTIAKKLVTSDDLSKRKLKDATTRKGQLKLRGLPTKMLFDEEGQARDFYEHGKEVEQDAAAEEARRAYVEEESKRMREADVIDREVAREKRREKKRKRKEREREVSNVNRTRVGIANSADDGRDGGGRRRAGGVHWWRKRRRGRIPELRRGRAVGTLAVARARAADKEAQGQVGPGARGRRGARAPSPPWRVGHIDVIEYVICVLHCSKERYVNGQPSILAFRSSVCEI